MAMDRRTLVKYLAGASAAGALAGCISTEEPDDDGNGDDTGNGADDDDDGDFEEDEDWETVTPQDGVDGEAELWHSLSDAELDAMERFVDEFNEFDPTLTADEVSELEDQTTAAIPAGDGPELFLWAHDWIGDYHQNGFLSDQSDNLNIDPEEYFGENAESGVFQGEVHGLPWAAETVALVYNREYVDEAPETFDDVLEIAAEHHDPAGNVFGFCWPQDAYHVSAMPHGFGPGYYDEDTEELTLTDDGTIAGFEYIAEEVWEYMPQDPDGEAQQSIFMEGQSPFFVTGPWNLGAFDDNDIDFGVMPLPEADGHTPSPFTGVQLLYFTAEMDEDDERADAAVAFAEWLTTNTAIASEMAQDHGFIPVHLAFADDEDDDEVEDIPENLEAYSAAVENGQPMPTAPEFGNVWEPLETEWLAVLNEGKDVADAMADAEDEIRDSWD